MLKSMLKGCLKWTACSHNFSPEADTVGEEVLCFKCRALKKKINQGRERKTDWSMILLEQGAHCCLELLSERCASHSEDTGNETYFEDKSLLRTQISGLPLATLQAFLPGSLPYLE